MIHVITRSTKRYYEAKVEEAGKAPWLEYQLQEAQEDVAMWKAQSEDYQKQRDEERERTDELMRELRETRAQLDEARKPIVEMLTNLPDRLQNPVQGREFRKELALCFMEATPMGLNLRVLTDAQKPEAPAPLQGPEPFPGVG